MEGVIWSVLHVRISTIPSYVPLFHTMSRSDVGRDLSSLSLFLYSRYSIPSMFHRRMAHVGIRYPLFPPFRTPSVLSIGTEVRMILQFLFTTYLRIYFVKRTRY